MRLWWKDLGHSFFYKKDCSSHKSYLLLSKKFSQNSLGSTTFSSLSFGSSKEKNSLLLIWSLAKGGVKHKKEFFPFGKFFLLSSWFNHSCSTIRWRSLLLLHKHMYLSLTNSLLDLYHSDCIKRNEDPLLLPSLGQH
jgi:hypothetical protein